MTKPNCEAVAKENLHRQNFVCYFPLFEDRKPNKPPRIRPLFPRYIFIAIIEQWYCLRNTRGVSRVLMGEGGPELISPSVIANLRSREDKNGLYMLERQAKYSLGQQLRTTKGPFTGHPCVYEGMSAHDRVNVLIDMLGMKVNVELEETDLVAA